MQEQGAATSWPRYQNELENFSISLPQDWHLFDLGEPDLEAKMEEFFQERTEPNPSHTQQVKERITSLVKANAKAGGVYLAFYEEWGPGGLTFFNLNLNILRDATIVDIATLEQQLEPYRDHSLAMEQITVPVGQAIELKRLLPVRINKEQALLMACQQFYVPIPDKTYIFTFETPNIHRINDFYPLFCEILASFQVTG